MLYGVQKKLQWLGGYPVLLEALLGKVGCRCTNKGSEVVNIPREARAESQREEHVHGGRVYIPRRSVVAGEQDEGLADIVDKGLILLDSRRRQAFNQAMAQTST